MNRWTIGMPDFNDYAFSDGIARLLNCDTADVASRES